MHCIGKVYCLIGNDKNVFSSLTEQDKEEEEKETNYFSRNRSVLENVFKDLTSEGFKEGVC